ncbi:type IV toxin-antitoxin system YeeU family antitoxin, partial [Yersinia enterocolitica]
LSKSKGWDMCHSFLIISYWNDTEFLTLPSSNHLELMLLSGELNPRYQHCVTLYRNGLICEADSLGSQGYVYLAIYPTPQSIA